MVRIIIMIVTAIMASSTNLSHHHHSSPSYDPLICLLSYGSYNNITIKTKWAFFSDNLEWFFLCYYIWDWQKVYTEDMKPQSPRNKNPNFIQSHRKKSLRLVDPSVLFRCRFIDERLLYPIKWLWMINKFDVRYQNNK